MHGIPISESTSDAVTLYDLIGGSKFQILQDTSDWNPAPRLMREIIGGMTPDIVLRSESSGENRVYIEVKLTQPLNYGVPDSQIVRYFLHLLAMTERRKGKDIRRAVLLAVPAAWLERSRNREVWTHFLDHFTDIATAFEITLGVIYTSDCSGIAS